ncbi:MAG: PTS sugar transporter subunit IIC [Ruminococcaceae bacterium]|nr:PTS sugar transporter subunit IIC [Oscillospiraceae bacterium]
MEQKIQQKRSAKEIVRYYAKRYFIDAMGAMAQGLFASLLIGTIFVALGMIPGLSFMVDIGKYAQAMAGPAMAAAIAYSLKGHPLVVFSAAAVGQAANSLGGAGGPLAVFIIAIIAVECGLLVSKKTKVDIIVTPFVTVFVGGVLSLLIAPTIGVLTGYISDFIGWASLQAPFVAGVIISVVIGVCLTLPISSAAICAGLILTGSAAAAGSSAGLAIAGAAAVAGCCAQMVGFAVISFRENKWGGLLSQGIGTSMLQMPNIIRNPRIWIAPTLASAVTGPLAVCVFDLRMYGAAINSGMGTCGLLGPIGLILGWISPENGYPGEVTALHWIGLVLVCFVLPAVLSFAFNEILRKIGWVRDGDMKLDV